MPKQLTKTELIAQAHALGFEEVDDSYTHKEIREIIESMASSDEPETLREEIKTEKKNAMFRYRAVTNITDNEKTIKPREIYEGSKDKIARLVGLGALEREIIPQAEN